MNQFGKKQLLTKDSKIGVIISDCEPKEIDELATFVKEAFDCSNIDFCYIPKTKKVAEENGNFSENVMVFNPKLHLNFLGRFKDSDFKNQFIDKNHTILLCSCLENNKYVKKLIKRRKTALTVGLEKETLPNFAVSFRMENPDHKGFIKLAKKYLEKLS